MLLTRHVRHRLAARDLGGRGEHQRLQRLVLVGEPRHGASDRLDRPVVGIGGVRDGIDLNETHDVHELRQMIEDDHLRVEAEVQVRQLSIVFGRGAERQLLRFDVARGVVARVADPAAEERTGQRTPGVFVAVGTDQLKPRADRPERVERIGRVDRSGRASPTVREAHLARVGDHLDVRLVPEDRVAPLLLAVLDGLEQERGRRTFVGLHEAPVRADRSQPIAQEPDANGDECTPIAVHARREFAEPFLADR